MQGLKTEEREIDGLLVTTTQLPPVRALVLSKRLLPIVAPIIAAGQLEQVDGAALGEALESLEDSAVVQLLLRTLAGTVVRVDGEQRALANEDAINGVFAGRFTTMLRVAWFAIEVNFFPGGVGELLASAPKSKASR